MKKMPLAIIGLTLIVLVAGVVLLSRSSNNNPTASSTTPYSSDTYLYYWSPTCPHCKNVAAFMDTWSGKDKIKIDKRDITDNNNTNDFIQKASTICTIPKGEMGVPLLITPEGKCFSGDTPIIDYFKSLNL